MSAQARGLRLNTARGAKNEIGPRGADGAGASRANSQKTTAIAAISPAAIQNGVARLQCLASLGAVRAAITVPPIPIPYTPSAKPCRSALYQRFTNGTPTANEEPVTPSRKPSPTTTAKESWNSASRTRGITL